MDVSGSHGLQRAGYRLAAVGCRVNDTGREQRGGVCADDRVLAMHRWLHDPAGSQ